MRPDAGSPNATAAAAVSRIILSLFCGCCRRCWPMIAPFASTTTIVGQFLLPRLHPTLFELHHACHTKSSTSWAFHQVYSGINSTSVLQPRHSHGDMGWRSSVFQTPDQDARIDPGSANRSFIVVRRHGLACWPSCKASAGHHSLGFASCPPTGSERARIQSATSPLNFSPSGLGSSCTGIVSLRPLLPTTVYSRR